MATLGELKTRIIAETNRDDLGPGEELEPMLALCIGRAVEYHSDESFWFNRMCANAITAAGDATLPVPYSVRIVESVSHGGAPLRKERSPAPCSSGGGSPAAWSEAGDRIMLQPRPDAAYRLTIEGIAQIDAPDDDWDENVWTNEAADLIAARARFLLYRDVLRDTEGTQLAAQAEGEALERLRRETRRRRVTPLQAPDDAPWNCTS